MPRPSRLDRDAVYKEVYDRFSLAGFPLELGSGQTQETAPYFVHRYTFLFDSAYDVEKLAEIIEVAAPTLGNADELAERKKKYLPPRRGGPFTRNYRQSKTTRINMRFIEDDEDSERFQKESWYALSHVLGFHSAFQQASLTARKIVSPMQQSRKIVAVTGIEFVFEPPLNYAPEGFHAIKSRSSQDHGGDTPTKRKRRAKASPSHSRKSKHRSRKKPPSRNPSKRLSSRRGRKTATRKPTPARSSVTRVAPKKKKAPRKPS